MALEVAFSPEAEEDLFSIYVYVAEGSDLAAADAYDARLRKACLRLTDFPGRGTPRDDFAAGLRSVAFERRATIYYRVAGTGVEIVRVIYKGRDPERVFEAG